jgi:hypothetical protein
MAHRYPLLFSLLPCREEVADALIDRLDAAGINKPFAGEVDDCFGG